MPHDTEGKGKRKDFQEYVEAALGWSVIFVSFYGLLMVLP